LVEPDRELINRTCGARRVENAEAQHRRIAEPKRQPSDKTQLGDIDRGQAMERIDAIAHGTARECAGADVVADRVAREAGERRHPVRDVGFADRPQGEQIVERQGEIAGGDEQE
jgi:hypothetical protein